MTSEALHREADPLAVIDGWLCDVHRCPSPNFNARPVSAAISLLVIHNISLPPGEFGGGYIESFFSNRLDAAAHPYFETIAELEVSAHLLISRTGEITQFVSFDDRAWHAGRSCFEGRESCNDYSIGIELEGTDELAYTDVQYRQLGRITHALQVAYPGITAERIVGHSDIAPLRKTDPGDAFDWGRYKASLAR